MIVSEAVLNQPRIQCSVSGDSFKKEFKFSVCSSTNWFIFVLGR